MNITLQEAMAVVGVRRRRLFELLETGAFRRVSGPAGRNGKATTLIALESLPFEAQRRYLEVHFRSELSAAGYNHGDDYGVSKLVDHQELLTEANRRFEIVTRALDARHAPDADSTVEAIAAESGVSTRQLYRWIDRWESTRDVSQLVRKDRSLASGRFDEAAVGCLVAAYNSGLSKSEAYDVMVQRATTNGWTFGSYRHAARIIDERYDRAVRMVSLQGKKTLADEVVRPIRRELPPQPNDRWSGDHHEFDVFVRRGTRLVRPWITGWLDECTRGLVGWCLSEQPNSQTIALALFHGIQQKPGVPFYGVPASCHIDNGKDYKSRHLAGAQWKERHNRVVLDEATKGGFANLNIAVTFAQPYNAKAKVIERFFSTLCMRFSRRMKGYCGNRPGNQPAAFKEAWRRYERREEGWQYDWLDWDSFVAEVESWVAGYATRAHKSLRGRTPVERWTEAVAGGFLPVEVPVEACWLLLLKEERRRVTKQGIAMFGLQYDEWDGAAIYDYIGREVSVRYTPMNRDRIYVFHGDRHIATATPQIMVPYGAEELLRRKLAVQKAEKRAVREKVKANKMLLDPPRTDAGRTVEVPAALRDKVRPEPPASSEDEVDDLLPGWEEA